MMKGAWRSLELRGVLPLLFWCDIVLTTHFCKGLPCAILLLYLRDNDNNNLYDKRYRNDKSLGTFFLLRI